MSAPFSEFARRLHEALDFAGFARGRSRTGELARFYGVTRETARKWLNGTSLPELERMIALAVDHGVSFEWLATGRGGMSQAGNRVTEPTATYADREDLRVVGMIRRLPAKKRQALLDLLDD